MAETETNEVHQYILPDITTDMETLHNMKVEEFCDSRIAEHAEEDVSDNSTFSYTTEIKQEPEMDDFDCHTSPVATRCYNSESSASSSDNFYKLETSNSEVSSAVILNANSKKKSRKWQMLLNSERSNIVVVEGEPGDSPLYKCNICKRSFLCKSNVRYHDACRTRVLNFDCDICGQSFVTKYHYDSHVNTHSGRRQYKCPKCDKKFKHKSSANRHCRKRKEDHSYDRDHDTTQTESESGEELNNEINTTEFETKQTKLKFQKKSSFSAKLRSRAKHFKSEKTMPHSRETGGEKYRHHSTSTKNSNKKRPRTKDPLEPDEDTYFKSGNSKTSSASAVKTKKSNWKHVFSDDRGHITVIKGQPPMYLCTICHKTFTSKYNIRKHDFCITGEKPFTCLICGDSFTKKCNYDYHIQTHSGEKPFACKSCGSAYTQSSSLNRHIKSAHAN